LISLSLLKAFVGKPNDEKASSVFILDYME